MTRPTLPALSLRETRVRLLAWTLHDALEPDHAAGRGDTHGSRMNVHSSLWTNGSYAELQTALDQAERDVRREFVLRYVGLALHAQPKASPELRYLTGCMPANLYVPLDVSLAAGYLEGTAKPYRMPRGEQMRRWARRPALTLR